MVGDKAVCVGSTRRRRSEGENGRRAGVESKKASKSASLFVPFVVVPSVRSFLYPCYSLRCAAPSPLAALLLLPLPGLS